MSEPNNQTGRMHIYRVRTEPWYPHPLCTPGPVESRKAWGGMKSCYPCLVWGHRLTSATMKDVWGEKPQVLGRLCAGAENTGDLGGVLFYNFQLSQITCQHLSIPICKWRLLVPTQSFSEAGPKNKATPYQMLMHVVIHKNVLWFTKHCTKINYWWQIIVVYNHK